MTHPIEQVIGNFLSASAEGKAPFNQEFLDELAQNVKNSVIKHLHEVPDNRFRLRMSNIGKDLRQLLLEKRYGRKKASPDFLIKMLTGSLIEHVLVYIMKSGGLEIETSGKCSLVVADNKIDGEWDLKLKLDNKIYDVKTASEWSFKNKFKSYEAISDGDSFGYVDQLLGYCEAEGVEPGGWVVINKSSGEIKVLAFPKPMAQVRESFIARVTKKIKDVMSDNMPPCKGVVPETFYQKPTGNRILDFQCRYCDHKDKCHPGVTYEPSRCSKAKDPKYEYYVPNN